MKHRPKVHKVVREVDPTEVQELKKSRAYLAETAHNRRVILNQWAGIATELEQKYSESQALLRQAKDDLRKYSAQVHLENKARDQRENRKDILNVAFGIALGVTVQEVIRLCV